VRIRPNGEAAGNSHTWAAFSEPRVCLLVERVALSSGEVFGPHPLDVNERALPRAVEVVLEGGEGDDCWRVRNFGEWRWCCN